MDNQPHLLKDVLPSYGSHEPMLSRGVGAEGPIIYVDCAHCSLSTIMKPSDTTEDVLRRWKRGHGK